MGHEVGTGANGSHDPGNLACGICILHCMPGEITVAPQVARVTAFRFDAYPQPVRRAPASAGYDAPERPPKSALV